MVKKITYSSRSNGDGTYRGIVWRFDKTNPVLIVGYADGELFWSRKDAIKAAKDEYASRVV